MSDYVDVVKLILLCLLWYLSSSGGNILGKMVLNDFPLPMTVTMVQLASSALFVEPIIYVMNVKRTGDIPRRYFFTFILPLALGKFLSSVSSHISLWKVPVSYAHTVKATLPLFVVVLSRIILKEKQTTIGTIKAFGGVYNTVFVCIFYIRVNLRCLSENVDILFDRIHVYLSLLPIIGGVIIASVTELHYNSIGLISALAATFGFACQNIFSKKCLKDTGYHHLHLLVLLSRTASLFFLPVWVLIDLRKIVFDTESVMETDRQLRIFVLLFFDAILNMMQNIFAFSVLSMVTPLSYSVANCCKRIFVISASLMMLKNPVSATNVLGMFCAILGVLCYNKAKYDQRRDVHRSHALPYVQSDSALDKSHISHSKSDVVFYKNGHTVLESQESKSQTVLLQENSATNDENSGQDASVHSRSVFIL